MLNLELLAQSGDHCDDETGNHILCNGGEGSCFDPLGKVINGHQDEMVSIGCYRLDLSNLSIPHIANGQGAVSTLRGTGGICTLSA